MKKTITLLLVAFLCATSHSQCWQSISAGYQNSLAIKSDGSLWAWGDNDFGQLGIGTFAAKTIPTQVGVATNWKIVSCGENFVVAIKTDGTLWTWGDNFFSQLGEGGVLNMSNVPIQVGTDSDWSSVSAGSAHTLALKTNGTLWAWGWNFAGQVGDGTTNDVTVPTQIAIGSTWLSVGAGSYFSQAVRSNGTLWGWGDNSFGQIGDGTFNVPLTPLQVGIDTNWKLVKGGDSYTLAIKTNGTLWSWGANFEGNLGDGTTIDHASPLQVGTDSNWRSISTKFYHVSATKTNGTLWNWGFNGEGQIGDGTTIQKVIPTQIGTATNWSSTSAGVYHTISIDNDGFIVASGDDQFLQLGNVANADSAIPIIIGSCVSKLQNSQCGTIIPNLSTTIVANYITVAQGYRFRVRNVTTNVVQTVDRPVNSFVMSGMTGITLGTPYKIDVALKINNVWQPFYGSVCNLDTPSPISNLGLQCSTILTLMNQWVYTTYVPNVLGYRFKVTNTSNNQIQITDQGLNRFNFTQLPNRSYGTIYLVEVALKNTDGTYLPYNIGCTISTPPFPTSEVRLSQCDYNALSNTESFVATLIPGATEYRFIIFNTGLGYSYSIDRTLNTFNLNMFPGLTAGTTYSVQVAVKIDGIFGPYGKICNLTTPGGARAVVSENKTANEFIVIAYPNPFGDNFKLNIKTTTQNSVNVKVYDMFGKLIESKNLEVSEIENLSIGSNYPSGFYNIVVIQDENTQNLKVIKR